MKYCQQIKTFIRKNPKETIFISLILLLALALRLYRISEYQAFLGDEGRDVRVVRNILQGNLAFIGPQTSIGNMYLGPLYYYMMAPALFISQLSPVGPAVMMALLGTFTIGLTWFIGRTWFNSLTALLASLFFSLSPVAIIYSRSSWNPNPMPFFALICAWGIYKVWQENNLRWLPIVGISLAFGLQMHYLGLLLIPFLFVFWFLSLKRQTNKEQKRSFYHYTIYAILSFLFLMSPLVLFDIKHQGMNLNAFKTFFFNRQTTINLNPANSNRFFPVWSQIINDLVLGQPQEPLSLIPGGLLILSLWALLQKKFQKPKTLLIVWLGFALLGLGLYKQHVYAHYFGFIFPAVFLLLGLIISSLFNNSFVHKLLGLFLTVWLIVINLQQSPLKQSPNRQLQRTQQAVNSIIEKSLDQPFNFALIAKRNYDESYRYYFENNQASLVRGEDGITDQLFVICEDEECQPEGHPEWQIAIFGPSKVIDQWQIDYLKIFKLIHRE